MRAVWILMLAVLAIVVAALAIALHVDRQRAAEWKKFAREHHCEAVSTRDAAREPGSVHDVVPAATIYSCDDGEHVRQGVTP